MDKIHKAVIPAAGLGTRLYPASKAVKKEFFPIVDAQGISKPAIQVIIEEAIDSGIEQVCLIVQEEDVSLFRGYFGTPLTGILKERLAKRPEAVAQTEQLQDLDRRIDYVVQEEQEGFGHAVYCAKNWVGGAPFLLMLGDHIYRSHTPVTCARQILEVYNQLEKSVYAIVRTPGHKVERYGTVAGDPVPEWPRTYRLSEIREKPSPDYAKAHLRVKGLGQDEFFCIFGQYALTPVLFDYLAFHIDRDLRQRGEIQLTGALEMVRQEEEAYGYETAGERYDIGTPLEYAKTVAAFSALDLDASRQP